MTEKEITSETFQDGALSRKFMIAKSEIFLGSFFNECIIIDNVKLQEALLELNDAQSSASMAQAAASAALANVHKVS